MLDAVQLKDWGGVGHVNVPCTLHTCWMLRNWRVGVGVGHVNVPARTSAKFLQELSRVFAERGRNWRKKLTLQLLTIYMILRMLVTMLKMMMLYWWWWWWWWWWRWRWRWQWQWWWWWWWWWWWCNDDDVMMIMMIMMMMLIMMMTVQTCANKTGSFLKRRWCIFTCWMCKIIVSL